MKSALNPDRVKGILERLGRTNSDLVRRYPGESLERQPVHTVYGGAHLFKRDTIVKLSSLALRAFEEYAPNPKIFQDALGIEGSEIFAAKVYERVHTKLQSEAIEDYRIDFEDGFGSRDDGEEDTAAVNAGHATAAAMAEGKLPPFFGIRIKSLSEECKHRAVRTLDLYLTALLEASGGRLPAGFVLTLPKVTGSGQIEACAALLSLAEKSLKLKAGALRIEIMIEAPELVVDEAGLNPLPQIIKAGLGRIVGAHLGAYDYTAACGIIASQQTLLHPSLDFVRHWMKTAFANQPIWLADGATNVLPIGTHAEVHAAWRLSYRHIWHALSLGFYQGWDLHPAQVPVRYAAVYAFFLAGLADASQRLRLFIEKAAQATRIGAVFDDAATGQGLLNFFIRGLSCGALSEEDVLATGLNIDDMRLRSFGKILAARRPS